MLEPFLLDVVAWTQGGRCFGAGLYEPDGDSSVHIVAFVGQFAPESAPPGPPVRAAARTREYRPTERFAVGDELVHPRFGVGQVVRVAGKTIDVEFPDGVKRLAHAP